MIFFRQFFEKAVPYFSFVYNEGESVVGEMILGIGCDSIEIERIQKAARKESFLKRYFTEDEILLFRQREMRAETIAGNFAAKEAFVKALGTGFRGVTAGEISVLRNGSGTPFLLYTGAVMRERGIKTVHVSITHDRSYAHAFVILEGGN